MVLYFKEPRLNLTKPGEFLVRLVVYSSYIVLFTATPLLFFSDISSLRWVAALLALFLIDRALHLGEAERSLSALKGEKINLAQAITPSAYRALNYSFRKALLTNQNFYLILLKELMQRNDIKAALRRLSISAEECLQKIEEYLEKPAAGKMSRDELLGSIETLVIAAHENAARTSEHFIESRNIFVALSSVGEMNITKLFELFDMKILDLEEAVVFGRYRKLFARVHRLPSVLGGFAHNPRFLRKRVMNREWTARPTPILDSFSVDLTNLARSEKIGFLVGHTHEFETMLNIISRPGKPNALLVGEPGTGKSTMIAHLAFLMVKDDVPPVLFDKRLISLEISDLIADASSDVLAGRLQKITDEIIRAGNIVLFVPNVHDLFRTAKDNSLNAMDMLLPIIRSGEIPLIGESYPREFKQFIEPRSDFLGQFEVVDIGEIDEKEALRFLVYNSLILEGKFKVFITLRAVKSAVSLAHRYFRNKLLPSSAVDLLTQALARAKQHGLKILEESVVIEVAEEQSKVPIQRAGAEEAKRLLGLEQIIHKKLINQETAVKAVSRAFREYRSGLSRRGGPIATFLFVGPTGVGKTELSKILTEVQFGSKNSMERFDMSEYQDRTSIFRFIGTPDGKKTGALTDAVYKKPHSLVLLDEFEKAHPDILNLFLQVFDDGRLTDSLGHTVDFQNTVIIATSNAHSNFIKSEIEEGKPIEEIGEALKKKLTDHFRPELLNRFSDIIVFRNLNTEEIYAIANLLIAEFAELLKETHGIEFVVDEAAVRKISELGYSPVFGARPLRQVISEQIRSVLAEKILRKEIARGNVMRFVFENGKFGFRVVE